MRFIVLTALLASTAYADVASPNAATQMHTDDCAQATARKKACVIDMGKGEELDGKGVANEGSTTTFVDWTKAGSLITLRRDFIVEIIKSAEDL